MDIAEHPLLLLDAKLTVSQEQHTYQRQRYESNDSVTAKAFSSVLTYIIADAFDLSGDEILKVGYYISDMMSPLEHVKASAVPPVVLEEIKYSRYSQKLFTKTDSNVSTTDLKKPLIGVRVASLTTWVEGFSDVIFNSYTELTPMYKSRIVGSLQELFSSLGLDNDLSKTRPSIYLPNAIRTLMF